MSITLLKPFNLDSSANYTFNKVTVTNSAASTDTVSGALVVTGGAGIGGNVNIGSILHISSVGNLYVPGGSSGQVLSTDGSGNLSWVTPQGVVNGTSNVSIPTLNGNILLSVGGTPNVVTVTSTGVNVSGTANITGTLSAGNLSTSGNLEAGNATITGNLTVNGTTLFANVSTLSIKDPIIEMGGLTDGSPLTSNDGKDRGTLLHYYASSSPVDGFMGWDNSNAEFALGSNVAVSGEVVTFNEFGNLRVNYIFGNGSQLSSITGGNVTGQVGNALIAGTVYTNAQPNITSVGTLSNLSVTGNVTSGNVKIDSLGNQQIAISLNGVLVGGPDLLWEFDNAALFTTALKSNGYISISGNLTSGNANLGNIATANYFVGDGSQLTGISATTGNANLANYASYVIEAAQGNITSLGTLATLDVSGNITAGNANLGNLVVANFFSGDGSLLSNITGSNVTGEVAYAATANSVSGSNVSGEVSYAATANSVSGSNVSGQVGNALIAGTVYTNAQPNITSVGTLSSLDVSGNITAGNANLGNLVVANFFSGDGSLLTGIQASSGTATTAGTVTGNAQPNITSVGTLVSLDVSGNITAGNANLGNLVVANFFSGDGSLLSNITGSNVTGEVSYAATANSVSGSNVSGEVAYAATANSVSGSNVSGQVGNALIAGTVYTNAQPNITSVGTLSSLDVTGNITSGNANLGNLVTANYFVGDGSLLTNIDPGSVGEVANANYATYSGHVIEGDQSNITSLGTLVSLSAGDTTITGNLTVTGTTITANVQTVAIKDPIIEMGGYTNGSPLISDDGKDRGTLLHYYSGSNVVDAFMGWDNSNAEFAFGKNVSVSGEVVTFNQLGNLRANYYIGDGSRLTNIAGGNVTGQVSNALIAGTVYTNAQPNITSLGTLVGLTGVGTIDFSGAGNVLLGDIGNVYINGGQDGQILVTDGAGNLQWVDNTPSTVVYTANSISLTNGVYVSGSLSDIQTFGDYGAGNAYILTDGTGSAPAWYVTIDFVSVTNFNRVVLNINYTQNSGHTIYVQLYNNSTSAWDSIGTYTGLGSYYAFALQVIDDANYINSGVVQLRLYHSNGGVAGHQTSIDYAGLELSTQGPQGPRGPTGATGATGAGVASGGTAGQILTKNSSTNYDTVWSSSISITGNVTSGNASLGNLVTANYITANETLTSNTITINVSTGTAPLNVTSTTRVANLNVSHSNVSDYSNLETRTIGVYYPVLSDGTVSGNYQLGANANITYDTATHTLSTDYLGGTLTTAAQPNVTSVGQLSSLTVLGNIDVANVNIDDQLYVTGNVYAPYFIGDVSGNVIGTFTGDVGAPGSNREVLFNSNDVIDAAPGFTFNKDSNTLAVANTIQANNITVDNNLTVTSNIDGGNISGDSLTITGNAAIVGNLTISGTTIYANVTSLTIKDPIIDMGGDTTGSPLGSDDGKDRGTLLKYHDGTYPVSAFMGWDNSNSEFSFGSNVGVSAEVITFNELGNVRAGYFIGNGSALFSITGGNVTGEVAYAAVANSVAGANVSGDVSGANHANVADLANSVSGSNVSGEVAYAAVANSVAASNISGQVANALIAGTVYTNAQPNITSVGTLANLVVSNDATVEGIVYTDVITARTSTPMSINATGTNKSIILAPTGLGNVEVSGKIIANVGTPSSDNDAATKVYVDHLVATTLSYHPAVDVATTTVLATETGGTITYNNGADGVGANIVTTGSFSLIDTFDVTTVGTRILVKNEANAVWNGVYTYANSTTIVRATDADSYGSGADEFSLNDYFFVINGDVNKGSSFVVTTPGVIAFGTSYISFSQFSTSQVYTADTGLSLSGTAFSIANTTVNDGSYGNATHVSTFTVNKQGQLTAAGTSEITANANILTGTSLNSTVVSSNLTSLGTLVSLAVTGNISSGNANLGNAVTANFFIGDGGLLSNINPGSIGTVANANYSQYAGTVTGNAQPNITSLGTLASLDVNGVVTAVGFTANTGVFTGNGSGLTNITGANVIGQVGYAAVANSVAGSNVSGEVAYAAVANVANTVAGGNVTGQVANALVAGTVYTNAQPNITSVGTLSGIVATGTLNFTGAGNVALGPVGNVYISGGVAGQVLSTNGSGGLSWESVSTSAITNGNSNVIVVANANVNISSNGVANVFTVTDTGANVTGTFNATGVITGNGYGLSALQGSNVSGQVSNALIAGTVYTNAQPNITSLGTLVSLNTGDATVTGNLTVNGTTIYANVTSVNIKDPVIELGGYPNGDPLTTDDGKDRGTLLHYYNGSALDAFMGWDASNSEFAFGSSVTKSSEVMTFNSFGNVRAGYFIGNGSQLTGIVPDSNYAAYAGNVTLGNQPNITAVGTLTSLTVTGNISSGNANLGTLGYATYLGGTLTTAAQPNITSTGTLTSLTVTGNISSGNANLGNLTISNYYSGVLTTGNQPNITSTGTLTSLTVTGNISSGNANLGNLVVANFFSGNGSLLSSIAGGNVTGQVGNALIAGTVYTGAQPNITSVGTLSNLSVTSNVSTGNLKTDNLLYANGTPYTFTSSASGSNTQVQFNDNNSFAGDSGLTYNKTTTTLTANNFAATSSASLGDAANIIITGGSAGDVLTTNGAGDLSWQPAAPAGSGTGFLGATKDSFTGNGSQTTFGLSVTPNSINAVQVSIDGLTQQTGAYILSTNNVIFSSPPASGSSIEVTVYTVSIPDNSFDTQVYFGDSGNTGHSAGFTFNKTSNTVTVSGNISSGNANLGNLVIANYFSGNGSLLSHIVGGNVSGEVAYAAVANSVSVSNVSGIGNIATINKDGSSSNVLYGNGVFAPAASPYGNSNVATFLASFGSNSISTTGNITVGNIIGNGQALTSINGANVIGAVTYATTANSVSGSNVSGEVSYAAVANSVSGSNVSGAVTYATTANSVSGSNVSGQVSNALIAGTVYTNAQPNITSVGTLTSLSVTGNISSGNANLGNLAVANFFSGDGGFLSNIQVGAGTAIVNGTSNVAVGLNSNVTVGIAGTSNVVVISSTGAYVTGLASVTGNISSGNANLGNLATANYFSGNGSLLTNITGGNVSGEVSYAAVANSVSGSNVSGAVTYATTANSVAGSNVSGQVSNALIAGTVYTNAQPNITSVGTLVDLSVSGNAVIGGNLTINGTVTSINSTIVEIDDLAIVLANDATNSTQANGAGIIINGASANMLYISTSNAFTFSHKISADGGLLSNITGGNVTGQVGYAAVANSVSGSNVSGPVAYATTANSVSGGNVSGEVAYAAVANSVSGSNVSGQVSNALIAGTVYTNAQPNITSVGTLASLSVTANISSGNANLGNAVVANFFVGDGGYLSNIQVGAGTAIVNGTSNVAVGLNGNVTVGVAGTSGVAIFASTGAYITGLLSVTGNITSGNANLGNLATANYFSGNGSLLTNITGGNVIGEVSYAAVANSVAGSNVNGQVTYAATANSVSGSNVSGAVAYATTANSVTGSNVSGEVSYAAIANSVSGSNVSGAVAYATTANSVTGSNVSGQVSNALIAGTVYTNAQPNITSIGTLTSLTVSGNISSGNANLGNLVIANYFSGNGSLLTNITGGNVSGEVSYAAVANSVSGGNVSGQVGNALIAGTVYTNAQPNITSVGTLTSLTVSGNITSSNANLGNLAVANFFSGDGGLLSNIQVGAGTAITNGTSNVAVGLNSNVTVGIAGTANVIVVASTGAYVTGLVSVTGNVSSGNADLGNLATANYFSGNGSLLSSIAGGNVTGQVGYAAVANSVSGSNVSGAVTYATTANSVAGSNVSGEVAYAAVANSVAGSNVNGQVTYAATANSVAGGNVSGQVSNALIAGTVYTNAQPNITSLGTLASLSVTGDISGANLILTGNLTVSGTTTSVNSTVSRIVDPIIELGGGANGAALTSDDNKDRGHLLHYYSGSSTVDAFMGWDDSNAEFAFGSNVSVSSEVVTFTTYGNLRAGYFIGNGSSLSSITGSNVTGEVSYAAVANSVSGGNVSGQVTYAATANSVSGSNVSGAVAYATTANSVAGGNVSGEVAYAAVANSVAGSNVSGQVSNALIAGTVYTNAQPNITSLGTLTSLSVTGNISSGNANLGNLITSNYYAGVLTTGDQPNITSHGNLIGLTVSNASGTVDFVTTANVSLGAVANLHISGGSSGYVLSTDGSGSLSWVAQSGGGGGASISNGTSNVNIATSGGNVVVGVAGNAAIATFTGTGVNVSGTLNATGNANVGNLGTAQVLASANVTAPQIISNVSTGTAPLSVSSTTRVSNLNVAYANVSDYGVVTTQSSGTFYPVFVSGSSSGNYALGSNSLIGVDVANSQLTLGSGAGGSITGANLISANYFTGTLTTAAQPNITSVGTLVNTTMGSANSLSGGNLVSATYLTGTLTTAAQPNITSVGTMTTITHAANANVIMSGSLSQISGANLVSATYLTGTLTTGAQPNITSTGTLTSLTVGPDSSITMSGTTGYVQANSIYGRDGTAAIYPYYGSVSGSVGIRTNLTVGASGTGNLTVNGLASVTGNISSGNANLGNLTTSNYYAGVLTTAAQPNITSVGSLVGLTVSNASGVVNFTTTANVSLGSVSNLHITGGSPGYFLSTDSFGGLSWASGSAATIADDTSTNATYYPVFATSSSGSLTTATISSTKLTYNPSTGTLTAQDLNTLSDMALKENSEQIQNPIEVLTQLFGMGFNWKNTKKKSYGLMAQMVEKVLPELVNTTPEGVKTVNYIPIIAFLIEAIKKQQEDIDSLKKDK